MHYPLFRSPGPLSSEYAVLAAANSDKDDRKFDASSCKYFVLEIEVEAVDPESAEWYQQSST